MLLKEYRKLSKKKISTKEKETGLEIQPQVTANQTTWPRSFLNPSIPKG